MNKMTRAIVMTGAAVAAGLTVAAGPAAASPATASTATASEVGSKTAVTQQQDFKRRDRIFGFYNSPRTCHKIGKLGQWKNQWERYSCFKVYRGFHSGDWALKVYYGFNYHQGNKHWNNAGGQYGGGQYGGGQHGGGDYHGGGQYNGGPDNQHYGSGNGPYQKN
ncbi:hypothetical protein QLQ12_19350 [Actinoplanes sp. NEAU-A12]|uniref:Uncharacterized protein n=1 Tax=Actinoplanes sandaracinus TaxID=3045177 RepID=A0ABT6WM47_9ACTN|nr:hypothetical protein [Actinoplanes sandaracinus]MDI6100771.1 hypothetical protein [Actinoplanes sandaracinus]